MEKKIIIMYHKQSSQQNKNPNHLSVSKLTLFPNSE